MFHAFDKNGPNRECSRSEWMALLARAPLPLLEQALRPLEPSRNTEWLRRPETGLYMVQGRAGGTGDRFNLGEITVTRCALRCRAHGADYAPVGVSYVLGRSHRQAELAAVADALLQDPAQQDLLIESLLNPVREHLALQAARRQMRTQATKVDFFTVAREAGSSDSEEDEE